MIMDAYKKASAKNMLTNILISVWSASAHSALQHFLLETRWEQRMIQRRMCWRQSESVVSCKNDGICGMFTFVQCHLAVPTYSIVFIYSMLLFSAAYITLCELMSCFHRSFIFTSFHHVLLVICPSPLPWGHLDVLAECKYDCYQRGHTRCPLPLSCSRSLFVGVNDKSEGDSIHFPWRWQLW